MIFQHHIDWIVNCEIKLIFHILLFITLASNLKKKPSGVLQKFQDIHVRRPVLLICKRFQRILICFFATEHVKQKNNIGDEPILLIF